MLVRIGDDSIVRVNGCATDICAVPAAIEAAPKAKTGAVTLVGDAAYEAGYTQGVSLSLAREAL